ncbi:MAG TPA: histidinol-phosphatase [Eubacteriaceae bacterium]|nr:histidinol-phosphatase [Eubacteriaceae bacterium]
MNYSLLDYHTHTNHSWDGSASIKDMCKSAVKRGVSEICFTDHLAVVESDPCYGWLDKDRYQKDIESNQALFDGTLTIKKGLEVGEPHLQKEDIAFYTKDPNLDFIIGSVHNIEQIDLTQMIPQRSQKENYRLYFEELFKAVAFGDLDVIGHFDLLKRYDFDQNGPYSFAAYSDIITEILRKAVDRGIGLEINTSGFRSSCGEIFPSTAILKRYRELGGELLTVGSDAHDVIRIGENIPSVYALLERMGFRAVFSYEKRQPVAVDLCKNRKCL